MRVSGILFLVLLLHSFSEPSSAAELNPQSQVQISFLLAIRGGYVFPGSDPTRVTALGLLTDQTYGTSGKSYAFRPYGGEAALRFALNQDSNVGLALRAVPMSLRLTPDTDEQGGWDAFLTAGYGFLPEVSSTQRLGLDLAFRLRRWQMEDGPIPSMTHAGFIVAARIESSGWNALFEAGLMALGVATPASLGVQRDSSTLRARIGVVFEGLGLNLSPWLEYFHTHRDFYGSTLVTTEPSLFLDEASLLLGIGAVF